jgi:hypothetical protein
MAAWWDGMAAQWRHLLEFPPVSGPADVPAAAAAQRTRPARPARLTIWRYFEMDCVLTGLRERHASIDDQVRALAEFPVTREPAQALKR